MTLLTTTDGQKNLPRYFARVFAVAQLVQNGRLDIHLPDGRSFRVEGPQPGPVAEVHVHNVDLFARTVRDGDVGFCEAYMDGWWDTHDLMAFFDFVHADNEAIYDGYPALTLVKAYERVRFWLQRNTKKQARKNI